MEIIVSVEQKYVSSSLRSVPNQLVWFDILFGIFNFYFYGIKLLIYN